MTSIPPPLPIKIIHASGSDEEIGAAHARAVGDTAHEGMVPFLLGFWRKLLTPPTRGLVPSGASLALRLAGDASIRRLTSALPASATARVRGLAREMGMSPPDAITALILPELLPLLQGRLACLAPWIFVPVATPRFGCSSFVSRGRRFLHGRNLDFPGVGHWDRFPVVQVVRPQQGYAHVGFVSAGVVFSGITGINEKRISVSLHQHYGKYASLRGCPAFVIGESILNRAASIEEAIAVVRASKVATSWAFIVTDGKTRDAVIIERHPRGLGLTRLGDRPAIAHSNFFQCAETRDGEYATSTRMNWDNQARQQRLLGIVEKTADGLDPAAACLALSDHYDPYLGVEKPLNRTVSQLYNIQSIVIDPENMLAWIAEGDAPIHLGRYRALSLTDLLAGGDGRTNETLPGYRFATDGMDEAKRSLVQSLYHGFRWELEPALAHAEASLARAFSTEGAQIVAVLSMKLADPNRAVELLERAAAHSETAALARDVAPPPEYFESLLQLARANDLAGKHEMARDIRKRLASDIRLEDRRLRNLARGSRNYNRRDLDRIVMPFSTYVPFM